MSGMWGRPAAAVDVFTKGKQGRSAAGSACKGPLKGIKLRWLSREVAGAFLRPSGATISPEHLSRSGGEDDSPSDTQSCFHVCTLPPLLHSVHFLFFLVLFTFWRPSLCPDCGKVFRNDEVILYRQLPPPLPPLRRAPPQREFTLSSRHESPCVSDPLPEPLQGPDRTLTRTGNLLLRSQQEPGGNVEQKVGRRASGKIPRLQQVHAALRDSRKP